MVITIEGGWLLINNGCKVSPRPTPYYPIALFCVAQGTWTYVFIMDTVVANANYDIEKLFQEQYSLEKSAKLFKQYESNIARSDFHAVVQSKR